MRGCAVKIVRVEAIPLAAQFKVPFKFGHVTRTTSANTLIRIEGEDGVVGWGESCPVPQVSAETQATICELVEERIAPELIGRSAYGWRPVMAVLRNALYHRPITFAGISTALLDLAARSAGVPAYELLGGAFRDRVEIHGSVTWNEDPQVMVETALGQTDRVSMLKVYLGTGTLAEDLARLEAVRTAVGESHPFMLDVNELWSPLDVRRSARALSDLGVQVVEQPVSRAHRDGMREAVDILLGEFGIDVIADESVDYAHDVVRVAQDRLAPTVNIGLSRLGGPFAALETANTAVTSGLDVTVGSLAELGVATAAGMHLAAALPALKYPSNFIGQLKYADQITLGGLTIESSCVRVPQGPGLGVDIDVDAVARLDLRSAVR